MGTLGVLISFVLALIIGGVSGYFGGLIDGVIQMVTDAVRTVPIIPLFMAIAAFIPQEWSSETRFFFISIILGLIGWPTLARRVRTHLLTERNQEYVLAAQLCGARPGHVIRRHLLPSFTSYIIVDLVISFPYMVLSRDRALLHRPRPEGPGELPGRHAAEHYQRRRAAELPVVLHPGDLLHRAGDGLRLRRRRIARCRRPLCGDQEMTP